MNEETKKEILDLVYPIGIVIGWHDDNGSFSPDEAFGGEWLYVGEMIDENDNESDCPWHYSFYKRVE